MAITTDQLEIKIAVMAKESAKAISEIADKIEDLGSAIKEKNRIEEESRRSTAQEISASKMRIAAMREEAASTKHKNDLAKESARQAKISADTVNFTAKAEADAVRIANQMAAERERTIRIESAARKRAAKEAAEAAKQIADSGGLISTAFSNVESFLRRSFAPITALNQAIQLASFAFDKLATSMRNVLQPAIELQTAVAKINTLLAENEKSTFNAAQEISKVQALTGGQQADIAAGFYDVLASGAIDAAGATEFMVSAQNLAVGGMTTTAEAVKILRSVIAAYGLEAKDATEISDALFIAARDGATDVQQLSQELGAALGVASMLGVSYQELTSFISAITLTGVSTSEAVTSVISAMVALSRQTEEMSTALRDMGITSIEAQIAQDGLVGTLRKITKETGGSAESVINLMGRVEAMKAVSAATSTSIGSSFDKIFQNIEKSAKGGFDGVNTAVTQMKDTAEYQFNKIGSLAIAVFSELGSSAMKPLTESLRDLSKVMMDLVPVVKGVSEAFKKIDFESITDALKLGVTLWGAYKIAMFVAETQVWKTNVAMIALAGTTGGLVGALSAAAMSAWAFIAPIAIATAKIVLITGAVLLVVEAFGILIKNWDWLVDKLTGGSQKVSFELGPISKIITSLSEAMGIFSKKTDEARESLDQLGRTTQFQKDLEQMTNTIMRIQDSAFNGIPTPQGIIPQMIARPMQLEDKTKKLPTIVAPSPETDKAYAQIIEMSKKLRAEIDKRTLSEQDALKAETARQAKEIEHVAARLKAEGRFKGERVKVINEARALLYKAEEAELADLNEKAKKAHTDLMISLSQIEGDRQKSTKLTYQKDLEEWKQLLESKKVSQDEYNKAINALTKKRDEDLTTIVLEDTKKKAELQGSIILKNAVDLYEKLNKMGDILKGPETSLDLNSIEKRIAGMTDKSLDVSEGAMVLDTSAIVDPYIKSMREILKFSKDSYSAIKELYGEGFIPASRVLNDMDRVEKIVTNSFEKIRVDYEDFYKKQIERFKEILVPSVKLTEDAKKRWSEISKVAPEVLLKSHKKLVKQLQEEFSGLIPDPDPESVKKWEDALSPIPILMESALNRSVTIFGKFGKQYKDEMDEAGNALRKGLTEGVAEVEKFMSVGMQNVASIFPMLLDKMFDKKETLVWLASVRTELLVSLKDFEKFGKAFNEIYKDASKSTFAYQDALAKSVGSSNILVKSLKFIYDTAVRIIGVTFAAIGEGIATLYRTLVATWKAIKTAFVAALTDTNIWVMIIKYFNMGTKEFKEQVWNSLQSVLDFPQRIAENIPTLITSVLAYLPQMISNIIQKLPEMLVNIFSGIAKGLAHFFINIGKYFGESFVRGFADSFIKAFKIFGQMIQALFTGDFSKVTKDVKKATEGWLVPTKDMKSATDMAGAAGKKNEAPARFKAVGGAEFRVKDYQGAAEIDSAERAFMLAQNAFDDKTEMFAGALGEAEGSFFEGIDGMLGDGIFSMKEWGKTIWESFVKPVGKWFLKRGKEIFDGFIKPFKNAISKLKDFGKYLSNPLRVFKDIANLMVFSVKQWADLFVRGSKILEGSFDKILGIFRQAGQILWTGISGAAGWFGDLLDYAVREWGTIFTDAGKAIWDGFVAAYTIVSDWFSDSGKDIWEGFVSAYNEVVGWFSRSGSDIWNGWVSSFNEMPDFYAKRGGEIWNGFVAAFSTVVTWFNDRGSDVWSGFTTKFSESATWFMDKGKEIWAGFFTVADPGISEMVGRITSATERMSGEISTGMGSLVEAALRLDVEGLIYAVGDTVAMWWGSFERMMTRIGTWFSNWWNTLITGLKKIATQIGNDIAAPFYKMGNWFDKNIIQPLEKLVNAPKKAGGSVKSTVEKGGDVIADVFGWHKGGLIPALAHGGIVNNKILNFQYGGSVPGIAPFPGDSIGNDRVLALLSPGELVLPRTTVSDLMSGSSSPVGSSGTIQNVSIEIRVEAGANVDSSSLRRDLIPKVVEEIRRLSQNGTQIMSKRGVY